MCSLLSSVQWESPCYFCVLCCQAEELGNSGNPSYTQLADTGDLVSCVKQNHCTEGTVDGLSISAKPWQKRASFSTGNGGVQSGSLWYRPRGLASLGHLPMAVPVLSGICCLYQCQLLATGQWMFSSPHSGNYGVGAGLPMSPLLVRASSKTLLSLSFDSLHQYFGSRPVGLDSF